MNTDVSFILGSDWSSARLSQNPLQVLRQNTPLFATTYILYHPVIVQQTSDRSAKYAPWCIIHAVVGRVCSKFRKYSHRVMENMSMQCHIFKSHHNPF